MPKYGSNTSSLPIKSSDLKKEIVKKNKELKSANSSLKVSNKQLSKDIKSKENQLKSMDDLIFDKQMGLDGIDLEIMRRSDDIKDKNATLKEVINSLSQQMSERFLLEEEIEVKNNKVKALKSDIDSLYTTIKSLESKELELEDIKKDISKYKKSASSAKSTAKKAISDCLSERIKAAEQITSIQEGIKKDQALKDHIGIQLKEAKSEYKATSKKQYDSLDKINEEIKYATAINDGLETAISNYKKEIEDLKDIISDNKAEIKSIKDEYRSFKLKAFDEMARLKMKGKLENINKAGLGDVFHK